MPIPKKAPTSEIGYASRTSLWWNIQEDEDTPELRWPFSVDVYDRMRRQDAQVMSVLRAVTLPIRRTTWRLDPAGAKSKVVKFVAEDLGLPILGTAQKPSPRTQDRFSFDEHLRLALLMLPFGHAFFEPIYRIVDGQARLRKIAQRPQRTISHIQVALDGGLEWIDQPGVLVGPVRIPADRLLVYVHDKEGGNWLGQSLLRPAFKFWLLKDRALRTQATSLDRNGNGVPIYTAADQPEGINMVDRVARQQEEIDAGTALAQALRAGENSGAAIPFGAKLEMRGVQGVLPNADPVIRYYDEQIARAVLAHFLNLGTETGSWALGSTFADFFTLSLQTVADQIADTLSQHLVEKMVDFNFGEGEPAPRVTFDEIGSRHVPNADAIKALLDSGAILPDDNLDAFMRTTYGLPVADVATRRLPPPPPGPGGDNPANPAPDTGSTSPSKKEPVKK